MITGILIIARLGSTRLPNKHLIKVGDFTFIEWLTKRFEYSFSEQIKKKEVQIIIATSNKPENKTFETIYSNKNIKIFYGADSNIPLRQLECAEHYNLTNIISIDGDDILCSTDGALNLLKVLNQGQQSIKTVGLPLGMNSMAYSTVFLKKCLNKKNFNAKFETGWGRIFQNKLLEIPISDFPFKKELRFTLDYSEDSFFFEKIISHFGDQLINTTDFDIINFVLKNNLFEINSKLTDIYFQNFNNQKKAEI